MKFKTITALPTATDLAGLLKEARILAGFTHSNAGELAGSFSRQYSFGPSNYQKWEEGSKPGPNFKKALLGLLKGVCDESVYLEWESAYHRLEAELLENRAEQKYRSKVEALQKEESSGQVNPLEGEEALRASTFFSKFSYLHTFARSSKIQKLIFIAGASVFMTMGYAIYSTLTDQSPLATNDASSAETLDSINKAFELEEDQKAQVQDGLLVDTYIWTEKYKKPPSKPSGEIISSYVFKSDAAFYYYDNNLTSSTIKAMADKGTGFHYYGSLDTNVAGEHVFELRFKSIQHDLNQWWLKDCHISVNVNSQKIFNSYFKVGQPNYKSSISKAYLDKGINDFDAWFSCENLLGLNPYQDYEVYRNTLFYLLVKSPDQKDLHVIDSKQFKNFIE